MRGRKGLKGDPHPLESPNGAGRPVQRNGRLDEAVTIAHRPGLAVDRQVRWPRKNQLAGRVAPVDVNLRQFYLLRGKVGEDRRVTLASGYCPQPGWPRRSARSQGRAARSACSRRTAGSALTVLHADPPISGHPAAHLQHTARAGPMSGSPPTGLRLPRHGPPPEAQAAAPARSPTASVPLALAPVRRLQLRLEHVAYLTAALGTDERASQGMIEVLTYGRPVVAIFNQPARF